MQTANSGDRRNFLTVSSQLAMAIFTLAASKRSLGEEGDKAGVISFNHGHIAIVHAGSRGDVDIDIVGDSNHGHSLGFTAEEVAAILAGEPVTKISSTAFGHAHTVIFNG